VGARAFCGGDAVRRGSCGGFPPRQPTGVQLQQPIASDMSSKNFCRKVLVETKGSQGPMLSRALIGESGKQLVASIKLRLVPWQRLADM
jgi:hypothetical protein